jgi:hypothetical protein
MAALWQRWRGRPTVVLLFPSFFLYNFLSLSLCFFHSFQKISHPLFSSSPFVLSFPFCPPPVFSSSPLSFLFSPLSRSFSTVFLPLVLFSFPLYVVFFPSLSRCFFSPLLLSVLYYRYGCDGEWQWLLDEEDDELTMALAMLVRLSPLLFFSSVVPLWFSLSFSPLFFFQFSFVLVSSSLFSPLTFPSLSVFFFLSFVLLFSSPWFRSLLWLL